LDSPAVLLNYGHHPGLVVGQNPNPRIGINFRCQACEAADVHHLNGGVPVLTFSNHNLLFGFRSLLRDYVTI
jgi:hypothetical protein